MVALLSSGVAAAAAPAAQGGELEEVIVTASRTETNLQVTPLAVTALSAETLERQGVSNLLDLQTFTPSLEINARPGSGTAKAGFAIRGMGVNTDDSNATVGVYVDDVYNPSNYGNILGLLDVRSVEVLRGPQGTLFGRNTIAGAVQYSTMKPSKEFGGFVEATGGNQGRSDLQGAVNIPLGSQLAIRLSGAYKDIGGYVHDDFNNVDRGAEKLRLARAQLRWTPFDRLTVDFKAEYAEMRTNGRAAEIQAVNPNAQFAFFSGQAGNLNNSYVSTQHYHVAGYNAADNFKSFESTYSGVVTYELSDQITLKWINAYVNNRNRNLSDYDMTPLPILAVDSGQIDDGVLSEELRINGKVGRFSWTGGVYYADQKTTNPDSYIVLGPNHIPFSSTIHKVKSTSVYAHTNYDFTDQLSLVAGVRFSQDKVANSDLTAHLEPRATFTDTSPRVGLNYKFTDSTMLYVSVARGFRDGGFSVNNALPASYNGVLTFQPDTAWTYEAGMRTEFFNRSLRVNPTLFWTNWKGMQFNYLIPNPVAHTVAAVTNNAGDSRIRGLEIEAQWLATDGLMFTGSLSYLDGAYTRVSPLTLDTYPLGFGAVLGGVPGSVVTIANLGLGDPLQQTPKYKVSFGPEYTVHLDGGAKLVASFDAAYTDKQTSAVTRADAVKMPAYTMVNARLQFVAPGGKLSVSAFAQNLTNQYYLVGGAGFGRGYTVGNDEVISGRPRQFGLTLRYNF